MKKIVKLLATILVGSTIASPAYADEAHIELTIGVIDEGAEKEAVLAFAAGYDWDLSEKVYVGVEGSLEKVLADDTDLGVSVSGRLGLHATDTTKTNLTGGFVFEKGEDRPFIGAGIEQEVNENGLYVVVFYHHLFGDEHHDADVLALGLGWEF